MKNAPGDAGAEAAVLDWVRVDDDQNSSSTEYLRLKIFTEEGKKQADVEIPWVPGYPLYSKVSDISARTIRPDGTIVPFDGKIYDKVLLKVGRSALKAKTFTFADVQPGSILEYRYKRSWAAGYLLNTRWAVQRDIPILHAKLTLQPYDSHGEYGSFFTYSGLPAGKLPAKVGKAYELELDNMPALRAEALMPPEEQLRARVDFVYTDSTVPPEKFWDSAAPKLAQNIDKFIRSKEAKNVAAKLSAGVTDRRALLEKIYAHVQSMRNLSFEEEKTAQEIKRQDIGPSRNVDEVLRNGAGYDFELNRAFVAVARAAGFDADAMMVASRNERFFSKAIPDSDQMSGEIATVTLDGKPLYLDPGTPNAPFGLISWEKSDVAAIRVQKDGKPLWTEVPSQEPAQALTKRTADLHLNEDVLEGTIVVTFGGQEALVRRLATRNEDEAARKKAIEEEVKKWFPDGATLKLTELTGHTTAEPNLTAKFDVSLPNIVSRAGRRVVMPISVFTSKSTNPFAPTTRTYPVYFKYAARTEDTVKLTLPENLKLGAVP
ncbi:MAG: DUF3857 domain-containing protein, partial [Acidobacteriota bacterium]|nr:DUF3857 domain-containing protein [Acidobacteriota bacterium]